MMKRCTMLFALMLLLPLLSCSDSGTEPNGLGGETDIQLTEVGNEYGVYVKIGEQNLDLKDSVYIAARDNGVVTVRILIDSVPGVPSMWIPREYKNAEGDIDMELKFRVTSEGIQDYYYSGQDVSRPFTIARYDASVGDSYSFTTDDGVTVTRTITAKSEVDDWPLGFFNIKTIVTEEEAHVEGVDRVIFRTNHKFGLVYVEYQLTDGPAVKIDLMPWAMI